MTRNEERNRHQCHNETKAKNRKYSPLFSSMIINYISHPKNIMKSFIDCAVRLTVGTKRRQTNTSAKHKKAKAKHCVKPRRYTYTTFRRCPQGMNDGDVCPTIHHHLLNIYVYILFPRLLLPLLLLLLLLFQRIEKVCMGWILFGIYYGMKMKWRLASD